MSITGDGIPTATAGAGRRTARTTARLRQLPRLALTTARRIGWGSVVGCVASALLVVWFVTTRETATDSQAMTVLRWSAVLLAGAVATVLDDPTEDDLAGAVTPLWWRRMVGLLVVAVPVAAAWAVALSLPDSELPWAALTLEAVALVLLGTAVASMRRVRRSGAPAGIVAAVPPAVVLSVANLLPPRLALFVAPADEVAWRAAHLRWGGLAAVATVTLAVAARDRARRSPLRVARPATPRRAPASDATTDPADLGLAASPIATARPRPTNDRTETRSEAT